MKKLLSILCIAALTTLFVGCDKSTVSNDGQTVVVQPTWPEAFHYANASVYPQRPWSLFGTILIMLFVAVIFFCKWSNKAPKDPMGLIIIAFFLFVGGGIGCILGKPGALRINATPTVPIQYYKDSGQTHILDSLFKNNLMDSAPVKK